MYSLGLAGRVSVGGHFLRLGTFLPSFPGPLLQGWLRSKRPGWHHLIATKASSMDKVRLHKCKNEMVMGLAKTEGDEKER